MKASPSVSDSERAQEAKRILERAERDSEALGASSLARTANASEPEKTLQADEQNERIEILGKRIGRGLGVVALIALAWHLANTYILN